MENMRQYSSIIDSLIAELKKLKQVKVILYYGSIGMGYADNHSDIDVMCICTSIPQVETRPRIFEKIGVKEKAHTTNTSVVYMGGTEVAIMFKPIRDMRSLLRRFSLKDGTAEGEIGTQIIYTKPIYDPKRLLRSWKKAVKYPKWLQTDTVCRVQFAHSVFETVESAIKRRNYIFIPKYLEDRIDILIRVIYALNKRYYVMQKWFYNDVKSFKIKPRNCIKRMEKIKNLDNRGQLGKKLRLLNDFWEDVWKISTEKGFVFIKKRPEVQLYSKRNETIDRIEKLLRK